MSKILSDIAEYVKDKVSYRVLNKDKYVGIDNMLPNRGGITVSEYVPEEGLYTAFKKGDVLIGNIRPYFKKIWLAEYDGGCSPDVLCIRAKDGTSPLFLYALLAQDAFFAYDVKGAKGSKMPRGDKDHIMAYPVPELENEEGTGILVDLTYRKIQNNNAICYDLKSMVKLLYDYWFVQFDFPDENGKPYKSSGGKMVWNDDLRREIPEGWEVHRASEYISPVRGVSYSAEDLIGDGIPMFNLNSFNEDGTYKTAGLKTFSGAVADDRLVAPHDLIMCVTQQTDIDLTGKRNVIGKALFVPDLGQSRMTMSMDVVKLVADDPAKLAFFKYLFGLGYAHKYVVGYANGTKIKHLDIDGALSVPVAIPPKSSPLIQAFSERALTVSDAISNALNENQRLAELRDFLLPMLMNGQVKVGKGSD